MDRLIEIHGKLLKSFGAQNWWPMQRGFSPPEWEVYVGAVLTQNTAWRNVEKALANLREAGVTSRSDIAKANQRRLAALLRPAGYYNQKARKLKILASFSGEPSRESLLGLWGIGPETADSILLYALNRPFFVIDAYTKRVFARLGIDAEGYSRQNGGKNPNEYDAWQQFFESNLPKDAGLYKEFHALIVELAKRHCKKMPVCAGCPLGKRCRKNF